MALQCRLSLSSEGTSAVGEVLGGRQTVLHLPFGVDILPSPVMSTFTDVVLDPPAGREEGGNTRRAVSRNLDRELSGISVSVSVGSELSVSTSVGVLEKDIGLSIMAIHRAISTASASAAGGTDVVADLR